MSRVRVRGSVQATIVAAIAGGLRWLGLHTGAWAVLGAATIVLLAALISPRGIYAASDGMGQAIGRRIE